MPTAASRSPRTGSSARSAACSAEPRHFFFFFADHHTGGFMAPRRMKRGFLRLVKNTVNRVATPIARSGHGPARAHPARRTSYRADLRNPAGARPHPRRLRRRADVRRGRRLVPQRHRGGRLRRRQARGRVRGRPDRPCSTEDGLAAFGPLRSLVLRALRRHEFRRLHVESAVVADSPPYARTHGPTATREWAPPGPTAADSWPAKCATFIADLPLLPDRAVPASVASRLGRLRSRGRRGDAG